MLTPSKRAACQRYFEELFGVSNADDLAAFRDDIRGRRLSLADENALRECADKDASASFERAALSLLQALCDLQNGDRLWAAVKLYYSVFYALRCELLLNHYITLRAGRVLIYECRQGELCRQYNGSSSGDHGMAIALAKRYFSDSDVLQSQSIAGKLSYEWMKEVREIVHYRMRRPPELERFDPFFPDDQWELSNQVETFLADRDPYFCFDPDYAALALPLKRLEFTSLSLKRNSVPLDPDFRLYVSRYFQDGLLSKKLRHLL